MARVREGSGGVSKGSSTRASRGSTAPVEREVTPQHDALLPNEWHEWADVVEEALRLPAPPAGFWHRSGISARTERRFEIAFGLLLYSLAVGWIWAITHVRTSLAAGDDGEQSSVMRAAASVASALTRTDAPSAAYLTDAAVNALFENKRGESGKLRAAVQSRPAPLTPDTTLPGAEIVYSSGDVSSDTVAQPAGSGIWRVAVAIGNAIRPISDFSVITQLPFDEKKGGKIGLYYIGSWPGERRRGTVGPKQAPPDRYANPSGFIEVTRENAETYVSEHFKLADFLTHDQPNVWPKYLVLQLRTVDKLELVLSDLQSRGVNVSGAKILSGFRSPQYNAGGGNTAGRADLSRHMYGDAADMFIDSDGNGVLDDLNHDGRVNINDTRVIEAAVNRVEAAHPELVGGTGVYPAASGHGPFIHIDTRGYRARWIGGPGGG